MNTFLILLRGVNVGGKNKVPMAKLRACLEDAGFSNVSTYIASGNVIVDSNKPAGEVKTQIEELLPRCFKLDNKLVKALVLTHGQLRTIINAKPESFGEYPHKYYSDVIFLIDINAVQAMAIFDPREGVDKIWPGEGVIYSQRLGVERTKSRLNRIVGTPLYASMTIRSWSTTTKLLDILNARKSV
ncbi:MAG TPA: DUF1697 domain-containing protein [Candidatus Saccharimonadales bacterium]|nr:DUF1697 domain-containing protein [Candidatus Saccharimonadales bacterium]